MSYYVVHKGIKPGIYNTWDECKINVQKFKGAIFKKFSNIHDAKYFLKNGFSENIKYEDFEENNYISVYTDGSFIKKNKKIYCGYAVYIPYLNYKYSKKMNKIKDTINRAELSAIIHSIEYLKKEYKNYVINIFTDSMYCIYMLNGTAKRYEKNNFKKNGYDVKNKDLIIKLLQVLKNIKIKPIKIKSHSKLNDTHSINNDIVDKLAKQAALSSI